MPTHLENEETLIAEARSGSAEAFTTLVRQYDRNVFRVVVSICGNQEDAEDALQETFLKAFTHLSRFNGDSRFYTWLTRIAVNEALMKLRKRRPDKMLSLDEPIPGADDDFRPRDVEDWDDDPAERFEKKELRRILTEAIETLEAPYRTVFVLRDIEKISTAETAEMLCLSVPAVKSRLLRARLRLREHLNPYFKRG